MLIFAVGGKPENPEKKPRSRDENQQQTQPTCDAGSGNGTRDTAVGGECSHHYAIPKRLMQIEISIPGNVPPKEKKEGKKSHGLDNRILGRGDPLKSKECMTSFIPSGRGAVQTVSEWNFNNIEAN